MPKRLHGSDAEIPPILTDTAYGCNACFFAQPVEPKCDARQSRWQIVRMTWLGRDAGTPTSWPGFGYSPPWSPPLQRSDIASMKAETTNARCTPTSQASLVGSKLVSMFMKAFSTWIAEIATIEAISFCLSPPKLTLVIHPGQSGWLPGSILETKFS